MTNHVACLYSVSYSVIKALPRAVWLTIGSILAWRFGAIYCPAPQNSLSLRCAGFIVKRKERWEPMDGSKRRSYSGYLITYLSVDILGED